MKTKTCIVTILLLAGLASSRAQNTWTQKADFGGGEHSAAAAFSIGDKGYVGTGHDSSGVLKNDFWQYDSATNVWTQKADFPGPGRNWAVGFSIGGKGYIGTGSDFIATNYKDFWEYDPASDTWTQKANFGGVPRSGAVGFSIGGKGYLGTGSDAPNSSVKDFWEYDPVTDTWTQKASFGGASRFKAAGFSVAGHGYIGTGVNGGCCPFNLLKDVWEYDPASDTWTKKADFGGGIRGLATGFSINETGYIGTGQTNSISHALTNDLWAFDPVANLWSRKANFGGTARENAIAFAIGDKGYLGTGENENLAFYKDFWEYTPGDSGGSGPCISPPSGLVSWWSGDRTAGDVQGTNPGVLKNGATFTRGMVGPAFVFDGVNGGVRIPNSSSLSQIRITLDAWVYFTGSQNRGRRILGKDDGFLFREYGVGVNAFNNAEGFVTLPSGIMIVRGLTNIRLNTWYHIAMTHDGLMLRLYVNGIQDGVLDAVGDTVPTSAPGVIGSEAGGDFTKGIIDEAQIFDRSLSDAEILAIYQAGADGQCKPDIFVASIDPSYTVSGHGFRIATSTVIQDVNGVGINGATGQLGVILPSGSALTLPLKTDATGQANVSFTASDSGLYQFKVRNVKHPAREYDASLNIETSDTLLIP